MERTCYEIQMCRLLGTACDIHHVASAVKTQTFNIILSHIQQLKSDEAPQLHRDRAWLGKMKDIVSDTTNQLNNEKLQYSNTKIYLL